MRYDVFISHASEDKNDVVLPLAALLREHGLEVWVDSFVLKIGDSLRRKIDQGLNESKFGIVILSSNFFAKEWPKKELDALVLREDGTDKVILPILHNITHSEVRAHSPLLADKLAASTQIGLDIVANQILDVVLSDDKSSMNNYHRRTVIGISGASCSGKTWLSKKLKQIRPNSVTLFDLDSYYKNHSYVSTLEHRYDNPLAMNFEDALVDLTLLKTGQEVRVPVYDYETHQVSDEKVCKPNPLIVVEGIFVFANQRLMKELDIKVWVDAGENIRFKRRMERDIRERGRDWQQVIDQYDKDVTPGYHRYIEPLKQFADIIYENNSKDIDKQPMIIELLLSFIDKNTASRSKLQT
ncbi:TIR domain-containing protein [Nostoc sp. UHCC 0251]|uniref:TIR domain-containing protein n=1 Tax=Nostoc sp. UHCC 0251 TaxID=3110240 RepID=UPI002B1F868E|nr:TIR domain-containing protein [Nostoc sp. UHCC 0251]MEA5627526.1 TIR domain-containing protein [Nostoc sp. UHCC 0251]